MANAIELFKAYIPYLDLAYREKSATAVLDVNDRLVTAGKTANTVIVPVRTVDGLADYSRENGYVQRSTGIRYEEYAYNYDRGGRFSVDTMDNAETDSVAFGSLAGDFMRDKVIPEIDAVRFAAYAGVDGINKRSSVLRSAEDTLSALRDAMNEMDEREVSADSRYLFITPTLRNAIDDLDSYKSKAVISSFAGVYKVPQSRFYTAVDLLDGQSDNELEGGYKKAAGASPINFMIIEKSAVIQHTKHTVSKIITPEANQTADAYMFFYRAYGLTDVYKNKVNGIYLNYDGGSASDNTAGEEDNA
ncbi:MAG: hypothetical protein NC078_04750 [Ruminococcus sp.]|nr:hypothetical protein [Ruminococcus sp.]